MMERVELAHLIRCCSSTRWWWWWWFIYNRSCLTQKSWLPLLFVLPRWLVRFIYNRSCLTRKSWLPLLFVLPRWLVIRCNASRPRLLLPTPLPSIECFIKRMINNDDDHDTIHFEIAALNDHHWQVDFPPSWAPQARSKAWEVHPWELYPPDDPPRPSRLKAGSGPSYPNVSIFWPSLRIF